MERVRKLEYDKMNSPSVYKRPIKKVHIVGIDYTLYVTVILLVLIGIVMVFSASYYAAVTLHNFGRFHFLRSQAINGLIGFTLMSLLSNVNYRYWARFIFIFYWGSMFLLLLVPFLGDEAGGATRWIAIGGFRFQPSEPAKLATILMIAKILATKKNLLKNLKGHIHVGAYLLIAVGLVGIENLSTAIVIALIGAAMIFVASPFTLPFIMLAGIGGGAGLTAVLTLGEGFRMARIAAWRDPWSDPTGVGFQTVQSLYAIGSGGIFGVGLGNSRQKLGFIPEAHNDIIFSVIVEELGILGGGIILFLFGVFLWRAIKISINSSDMFGSLIATGIAVMVGSQALINVGVVTNTMPNTGVPLPFISFGGTSLIIIMSSVGLLLSISRYKKDLIS